MCSPPLPPPRKLKIVACGVRCFLSGTGRGNGMWKGKTGRGKLGVKCLSRLLFLMRYSKCCYSKGPGYFISPNLTRPSHISACCCQQLLLERLHYVLPGWRARLLCLTPLKSMLACFHGNGKRTNACEMIHLFQHRSGPFLTPLPTDNLQDWIFCGHNQNRTRGKKKKSDCMKQTPPSFLVSSS